MHHVDSHCALGDAGLAPLVGTPDIDQGKLAGLRLRKDFGAVSVGPLSVEQAPSDSRIKAAAAATVRRCANMKTPKMRTEHAII